MNTSSNHLKMHYTLSLWCCRDTDTVWGLVEKSETERGRVETQETMLLDQEGVGYRWINVHASLSPTATRLLMLFIQPKPFYFRHVCTVLPRLQVLKIPCNAKQLLFQSGVVDLHLLPVVMSQRKINKCAIFFRSCCLNMKNNVRPLLQAVRVLEENVSGAWPYLGWFPNRTTLVTIATSSRGRICQPHTSLRQRKVTVIKLVYVADKNTSGGCSLRNETQLMWLLSIFRS